MVADEDVGETDGPGLGIKHVVCAQDADCNILHRSSGSNQGFERGWCEGMCDRSEVQRAEEVPGFPRKKQN